MSSFNIDYPYKSHQSAWEKYSSVRSRQRKIIEINDYHHYYFPLSKQPIATHPVVEALGEKAQQFVLLQSCYKFMHDVAIIETEVVNAGTLIVANNRLSYKFPKAVQIDAFTVLIDEAYHAYVAFDFLEQLIKKTNIVPITLPTTSPVVTALQEMQNRFPPTIRDIFTVIAVCIGEHVLIKDLISVSKGKTVINAFCELMAEHVSDEGRHSQLFANIMTMLWQNLDNSIKDIIGPKLIDYFYLNFSNHEQIEFERNVLLALGLSPIQINRIFCDVYPEKNNINLKNPVIANIMNMLIQAEVFVHDLTRKAFQMHRLLS